MPRQHSAEFKFEIVRQLQAGEKRLLQLCREHELDPGMVKDWAARVERHGSQAFPRSATATSTVDPSARTLAAAETRIADLERLVGQLTLENEFLKKASRQASSLARKGAR